MSWSCTSSALARSGPGCCGHCGGEPVGGTYVFALNRETRQGVRMGKDPSVVTWGYLGRGSKCPERVPD